MARSCQPSVRFSDRRQQPAKRAPHPLLGDELRALRELKRQSASPFVFASERGGPFTPSGFAKLLARAGEKAEIGFKVHPHMLRHACGYALANKGLDTRTLQAYLGHRSINPTTRYAALAPGQFKNIWGRCRGSLQGPAAALPWRAGPRYAWPSQHPAHGALYGAGARSVQGFLAGLVAGGDYL